MEPTIDDKIRLLQTKISVEHDPARKAELSKQLQKLQLEKEIQLIRKRIENLS